MDEEVRKDIENLLNGSQHESILIKTIKSYFIGRNNINKMKEIIIVETKTKFNEYLKKYRNNTISELAINCFEERINTLPNYIIVDLYEDLQKVNKAGSEEAKAHFLNNK